MYCMIWNNALSELFINFVTWMMKCPFILKLNEQILINLALNC